METAGADSITGQPIRVLVCDDHPMFRAGVVGVLRTEPDIIVVGEARDGLDAIAKTKELNPDVVVMDLLMPRCDGLQALDAIKKQSPDVKVLVLTISLHDDHLLQALRLGANGYILKSADIDEVVGAVRIVASGAAMFSPNIALKLADQFRYPDRGGQPAEKMSRRETAVLQLMGQDMTNQEIATKLGISESTVRSYIRRLARKLQLKTRADVAAYAALHQDRTVEVP